MAGRRRRRRKAKWKLPEKPKNAGSSTSSTWTASTVLSLILGVIGCIGVIELRPQLSVSAGNELAVNQPFSTPLELTNNSYYGLHVDNVILIYHKVEYQEGPRFFDAETGNLAWDNFDLEHGGSKTILAYFSNGQPRTADIVVAVDYRFLWKKWRWFSRFEGIHIDSWQWSKQPMNNLEPEINKAVDDALTRHREANGFNHPA